MFRSYSNTTANDVNTTLTQNGYSFGCQRQVRPGPVGGVIRRQVERHVPPDDAHVVLAIQFRCGRHHGNGRHEALQQGRPVGDRRRVLDGAGWSPPSHGRRPAAVVEGRAPVHDPVASLHGPVHRADTLHWLIWKQIRSVQCASVKKLLFTSREYEYKNMIYRNRHARADHPALYHSFFHATLRQWNRLPLSHHMPRGFQNWPSGLNIRFNFFICLCT